MQNLLNRIQENLQPQQVLDNRPVLILIKQMIKRLLASLIGVTGLGYAYDNYTQSYIVERNFRTAKCLLYILYEYKMNFYPENYLQVHEQVAKVIIDTCINNDGLYVKFGESLATLDYILPPPIIKYLSQLQQQTKKVPYKEIAHVFQEDLGITISQAFKQFDYEPIASGSLAQVYKAILKNGQQVAVKIQKPYIQKQYSSDLRMFYLMNFVLEKAFKLPFLEFSQNIEKNLGKELNFTNQAANAKRMKKDIEQLKRQEIYVPQVIDEFTTKRVLVSEWIDGFKITNTQKIERNKFDAKLIMNDLIRALDEQIFVSGFMHSDPHPGNVFVRPHSKDHTKHQIVLLDFGLCLQIDEKFRKQYTNFWKCMFFNDKKGVEKVCKQWGVKYYPQFAGWQILMPCPRSKQLALIEQIAENKFQKFIRLQSQMKKSVQQLMKDSVNIPKELLYIIRRENLLRNLHRYHGQVANRVPIMMRSVFIGTTVDKSRKAPNKLWFYWQMMALNISYIVMQAFDWFWRLLLGRKIQNYVEGEVLKKTEKLFRNYGFTQLESLYNFDLQL